MGFLFWSSSLWWVPTLIGLMWRDQIARFIGKRVIAGSSPWISQRTAMSRLAAWERRTKKFGLLRKVAGRFIWPYLALVVLAMTLIVAGWDFEIAENLKPWAKGVALVIAWSLRLGITGYVVFGITAEVSKFCTAYYDKKAYDLGRLTDEILAYGKEGWGFRPSTGTTGGPGASGWPKLPRPGRDTAPRSIWARPRGELAGD